MQNHWHYNNSIDDNGSLEYNFFHCYDKFNNYTFAVSRRRETTFISPYNKDDKSLIELKVGVLLPFHQNNNGWTRVMTMSGISAIRLAVAEINSKRLIPGAYITLVEKDSYPKAVEGQAAVTQAVFSAISLIQEGVIGVIGDISSSWTSLSALMSSTLQIPQCSFSAIATSLSDKTQFNYFFRTVPTNLLYSDAAITFIASQGWPQLGVLYSDDDFGQQLSENVVMKARQRGIHVKTYQSFYEEGPKSNIEKSIDALASSGVRVIFIAAEGVAQMAALTVAAHKGYINDNTVWITINADTNTLHAAVNDYNAILLRRANNTDIVPEIYHMDMDSATQSSRSKKKQSMLDLIDPVEYAARTTTDLNPIQYNKTFAGGVFLFDTLKELPGYAPFEDFVHKWSHLDPAIYPYGGQNNISSNEGLAYSCMMVMANGFKNVVYGSLVNSSAPNNTLKRLAAGELGQYLTPSTFNTSFMGPGGPVVFDQNGDIASGNYKIYNIQNGSQIEIGSIIAGNMKMTSPPIYHDGTTKIPSGIPDRVFINPGYQTPITITLLVISCLGTLLALVTILLVLVYRKKQVFKASSPLFCVLELIGFILAYVSLFFFVGHPTTFSCTIMPITFHTGYSLILGNLIAKNYRIYRIFNNIFITKTTITDFQLLKVSGSILAVTSIILIAWFSSNRVTTVNVPVSKTAYYIDCEFEGVSHNIFISLLIIVGSFQLLFATFLAFKTRTVGRNYSKYSEYKQIGLSVYNIFFSVLIGFIIFFVPTTDYYTRHYLTATMIVWATTFSLLTLFLPKLIAFFTPEKEDTNQLGKLSELSGRKRYTNAVIKDQQRNDDEKEDLGMEDNANSLMSINYMIDNAFEESKVKFNSVSFKGNMNGALMEVHETKVPIQQVFKYFPFLAAWEMMAIVLMPGIFYFSFYSEKSKKGQVFAYSGSSVEHCQMNEYILKIHGTGMFDVLMQVESEKELMKWNEWFNQQQQTQRKQSRQHKQMQKPVRSDSGMTTEHLLTEDRRESETTVETLDSCFYQPILSNYEYGSNEIMYAREIQQERQGEQRSSFYASFNEFLNVSDSSTLSPDRNNKELADLK